MGKVQQKRGKLLNVLVAFVLLIGIGIMGYPFFSDWYNQRLQASLIRDHERDVSAITHEEKQAELEACFSYNASLLGTVELTDPFDPDTARDVLDDYEDRLNISGNGMMGYIDIPKISVQLAIYHGTSSEVLERGVGHLENTSLPVGGKATHSVLSAHTGYSRATMFNHLDRLEKDDVFYLTVLGDVLAYQVDQIKVVEPTQTGDLLIDRNEDYVTLVTCTPYGINSHRLLVRGTRIPYVEGDLVRTAGESYLPYVIGALVVLAVGGLAIAWMRRLLRRRRSYEG